MHIGHLRTAVIGESLKRIMRFLGDEVVGDAHFGDWGLQMGQLIAALAEERPDLPYFDEGFDGPYPEESPVTLADLGAHLSPPVRRASRARIRTFWPPPARRPRRCRPGGPGYRALWQHFVTVSREALIRDYGALGVHFDWWKGESDADPYIEPMIDDLRAQHLLVPDQAPRSSAWPGTTTRARWRRCWCGVVGRLGHVRHDRPRHRAHAPARIRPRPGALYRRQPPGPPLPAGLPRRLPGRIRR
ncbi:MAG: arginine--tRNA ligase [Asticcacaulis sp.]